MLKKYRIHLMIVGYIAWTFCLVTDQGRVLASEESVMHEPETTACVCEDDHAEEHDEHEENDHDHETHDHDAHEHQESEEHAGHDEHDEHDHSEAKADHADADEHAGHDHESENTIHLEPESRKLIGLQTFRASTGSLSSTIHLTGQIGLNRDQLAHIVPLTSGIVRKVNKNIGDPVEKNEILAWIESTELAQAKVNYLDIQAEIGCCAMNLVRAQKIHDNTLRLIEILNSKPALNELQKLSLLEMGENRSKLIQAYAEYKIALSRYEREKSLYEQKISSQQEYQDAENRLQKTEAVYIALLDTIRFQVKQDLLETSNDQRRQEIALKGAERTLYVLGQTEKDIRQLDMLVQNPNGEETAPDDCLDPNCTECRKKAQQTLQTQTSPADFHLLGWYPLRAAFAGTVIDKHVTLGERLSEDTAAFTIANMKSVWIDLSVFPKDLPLISKGQICQISFEAQTLEGTISFISPTLDTKTRTATARIILNNPDGHLRPGLFVTAILFGKVNSGQLIIPKDAVQMIQEETCVFVKNGSEYQLRPVTLGQRNATHVEILSGLDHDEEVVTRGAFDLKAKIVTSTLDSHAGHGH